MAPIDDCPAMSIPNPLFHESMGRSGKPTARLASYAQLWKDNAVLNCNMLLMPLLTKVYRCSQQVWGSSSQMATQQTTGGLEHDWRAEKHEDAIGEAW